MKNIRFFIHDPILYIHPATNPTYLRFLRLIRYRKPVKHYKAVSFPDFNPGEARRVPEIASNGQEMLLSYSDNNTTKAIPLNNSNNETPVTLSSFNFRTSRLLETAYQSADAIYRSKRFFGDTATR